MLLLVAVVVQPMMVLTVTVTAPEGMITLLLTAFTTYFLFSLFAQIVAGFCL